MVKKIFVFLCGLLFVSFYVKGDAKRMMNNVDLFKKRRQKLVATVAQEHGRGVLVLSAGFDQDGTVIPFRQDKDFYYFTGLQETGLVLLCYPDGKEELYIPHYSDVRGQWVTGGIKIDDDPASYGVSKIMHLGQLVRGYDCPLVYQKERYKNLINELSMHEKIFLLSDIESKLFTPKNLLWCWIAQQDNELKKKIIDVSYFAHEMRRIKDDVELQNLQRAIDITLEAQSVVAREIQEGRCEYEVKAALEYVFLKNNAYCSFPSIVATGVNGTILHYTDNQAVLKKGDLVVVDIGAEVNGYAADITRTFPVGGVFSERQKEVYDCVYETQAYVASRARPGVFLRNSECPDNSLHHLALAFLKDRGYDRYFVHGIGHYLGLDVHDVGDYKTPLQVGDVFTIEPGIYIQEEALGVRIEDDYLITEGGCCCLSNALSAERSAIEILIADKG